MENNSDRHPRRTFRKQNRLPEYDYSAPGYYFITICTDEHKTYFGQIHAGHEQNAPALMHLSPAGQIVSDAICAIPQHYQAVRVDKYVVMPNHVHLILVLEPSEHAVRISRIVQQLKRVVTIRLGKSVWQLGFHDHIIRQEADYREIWTYIDNNPCKWALDKYYRE